jgi:hypothetical protein
MNAYTKGAAYAQVTVGPNAAVMRFDNGSSDKQAQADPRHAKSQLISGPEEAGKEILVVVGGNTNAGIFYINPGLIPVPVNPNNNGVVFQSVVVSITKQILDSPVETVAVSHNG